MSILKIKREMNMKAEKLLKLENGLWKNDSGRHKEQQIRERKAKAQ